MLTVFRTELWRIQVTHELMTLPFAMDALAPHISKETLEYHYGKHHRTYVNKLNELIKGTELEGLSLSDLVKKTTGPTFNNAAQVWNHNFYWYGLNPRGSDKPTGELAAAIDKNFGSFDQFAAQFNTAAATKFGAGWTWLVKTEDGKLAIRNSNDAENPLQWNQIPLLTCDVWEHAYYIDYRNERPRYIETFWALVDWDFVARNLAGEGITF